MILRLIGAHSLKLMLGSRGPWQPSAPSICLELTSAGDSCGRRVHSDGENEWHGARTFLPSNENSRQAGSHENRCSLSEILGVCLI